MARRAGLRAQATRLRWGDLFKMGTALPAIVLLRDGTAMVLTRAEPVFQDASMSSFFRTRTATKKAPLVLDEVRFQCRLGRRHRPDQARLSLTRRGPAVGIGWIAVNCCGIAG